MTAVRVHAGLARYVVAARELPLSAVRAPAASADIAVVGGRGWNAGSPRPAGQMLVVAGDLCGSPAEIARLRRETGERVILERGRLRPDLVADALGARAARTAAPPRLVIAECVAPAGNLPAAVRDALGWTRELAGALTLSHASVASGAVSALLAGGAEGIPILLRASRADLPATVLRITAVGEVTTEVVLDEVGGQRTVTTVDRAGRSEAPVRFESVERVTLRRALDAWRSGEAIDDLADLAADAALASAVLEEGAAGTAP